MELTAARLRALIDYDPDTGQLAWKQAPRKTWPERRIGVGKTRRYQVTIDRRPYLPHRLAWLHYYGVWPTRGLDHINGDPLDNRISNLREASQAENMQNVKRAYKGSSTGLLGASFETSTGRYLAQILVNGKSKFLGRHSTAEEAHAAYLKAKRELHPYNTL